MGRQNVAVNQMLERKEIFSDLINGAIFGGRRVLRPERMELISSQSGMIHETDEGRKRTLERRGDIRMKSDMGTYLLIVANETQNKVHYAMPVRNMLYDALEYMKQVQGLEKMHRKKGHKLPGDAFLSGITKEDRISPVLTTVFYWGPEWDGSKSLYDMLEIDLDSEDGEVIRQYIPDYRINLIEANHIEDPKTFHTCLQYIFTMLKYNTDKDQLYQYVKENNEKLKTMDNVEITAMFALLGEQKRLEQLLGQKEEEEIDVCKAIDDLIKDGEDRGRAEGKAEGKAEGELRVNRMIQLLIEKSRSNDIITMANDREYQKKLFEEFGI